MRRCLPALLWLPLAVAAGNDYVAIPAGEFKSALKYEDSGGKLHVAAFEMMRRPVSNGDFLAFVARHPSWQRSVVPSVFAEPRYLSQWSTVMRPGNAQVMAQPVVNVSWFAAAAYCEHEKARLPTWSEWEYVAAADETRQDARNDPAWRERILGWYARPSNTPLAAVGSTPMNAYGLQDLHGLVWEWVDDYASMLVDGDNRTQDEQNRLAFCGAGAIAMDDREHYAVLMRVAMLSSLQAADVTGNLGFRCARDQPERSR